MASGFVYLKNKDTKNSACTHCNSRWHKGTVMNYMGSFVTPTFVILAVYIPT